MHVSSPMTHRWLCVCSSIFRIVVFHPNRQPPPTPPSIHATRPSHPLAISDATTDNSLPIPHPDPALRVLPDELLDPQAESVNGPGVPTGRNGGRVPNPVRRIPPRPPPRRPTTTTSATCPSPGPSIRVVLALYRMGGYIPGWVGVVGRTTPRVVRGG